MPDDGYIRDSLGWVYFRMGDIGKAIIELERAVKMVDDDPIIREHLGDVYLQGGLYDKALAEYQKSYSLYEDEEKKDNVGAKINSLKSRGRE
jgi:tetratricopeptide (TPR) repeat protein